MWALIVSAARNLARGLRSVFADLFAFLPWSKQTVEPGIRPLMAAVSRLVRILGLFLAAATALLIFYRLAMQRTGRSPDPGVLDFFPPRVLLYVNVAFLVVVFCVACWLLLRLLARRGGTPVAFSAVLQVFVRVLAAVLGVQLVLLVPPFLAELAYIAIRAPLPAEMARLNPLLDGLSLYAFVLLLLSFVALFLSTAALLGRTGSSGFVRAGSAVLLAGAITWGLSLMADPFYQNLVDLGSRTR